MTSSCFKVDLKIFLCLELSTYNKLAIFLCQKLKTYNNSVVVMGGVSWRGENQEIIKFMATAQFKMEDILIFYNVIEIFWRRKVTKV